MSFFLPRPAVVEADEQVVPIGKVGHADDGPQRKGAVRRREFVLVVAFPIGCFLAVERVAVEGGSPVKTSSMGPGDRPSACWTAANKREEPRAAG